MFTSRVDPDGTERVKRKIIITNAPVKHPDAMRKLRRTGQRKLVWPMFLAGFFASAMCGGGAIAIASKTTDGWPEDIGLWGYLLLLVGFTFFLVNADTIRQEVKVRRLSLSSNTVVVDISSETVQALARTVGKRWHDVLWHIGQDSWMGHVMLGWIELYVDCVHDLEALGDEACDAKMTLDWPDAPLYVTLNASVTERRMDFAEDCAEKLNAALMLHDPWLRMWRTRYQQRAEITPEMPLEEKVERTLKITEEVMV